MNSIDDEWNAYICTTKSFSHSNREINDSKYTNKKSLIHSNSFTVSTEFSKIPSDSAKPEYNDKSKIEKSSNSVRNSNVEISGDDSRRKSLNSVDGSRRSLATLQQCEATDTEILNRDQHIQPSSTQIHCEASEAIEASEAVNIISGNNQTVQSKLSIHKPISISNDIINAASDLLEDEYGFTIKTSDQLDESIPKCDDLYISTKTKVLFLNQEIDIQNIYWKIPVVDYWKPVSGVVKKQMKIVSKTPEEYAEYRMKLEGIYYYNENIIKQIDNPSARRIKFKDERKITIGISRKDIMNCRGKVKNAFYNCFAIIIRFEYDGAFREIHVKVFNTGKLEIPGILNTRLFDIVKGMIIQMLEPHMDRDKPIDFVENEKDDNVLINSNFNCGYYINRDKLHQILRSDKYGIEAAYDPCSYPGVKCKFYFNNDIGFDFEKQNGKIITSDRSMKMSELIDNKKYTEVSFMIFRTGSCLIVGNCSEKILRFIFAFIRNMLSIEYPNISVGTEEPVSKNKKAKLRKKIVSVSQNYYDSIIIDKTKNNIDTPALYTPFM
jgi:hypothetical protein